MAPAPRPHPWSPDVSRGYSEDIPRVTLKREAIRGDRGPLALLRALEYTELEGAARWYMNVAAGALGSKYSGIVCICI